MQAYLASREEITTWLIELSDQNNLFSPQPFGSTNSQYLLLQHPHQIHFKPLRPSINPPGKKISPDNELLFSFSRDADGHYSFYPSRTPSPQILALIRPCDLQAIHLMDRVNQEAPEDKRYLDRRQQTRTIGLNCLHPCDAHCFCAAAGSLNGGEHADLLLTEDGDHFLVEPHTTAGETLLTGINWTHIEDGQGYRNRLEEDRPEPFGRQFSAPLNQIQAAVREQRADTIYQNYSDRCFSCGTCNLVCPTCYCFEIEDDLTLDGNSGERRRTWDSCMNSSFAEVAGEHNFRSENKDRQRHRIRRKFNYLSERLQSANFCVGCGRCGRQCTTDIDIFDMVNAVYHDWEMAK